MKFVTAENLRAWLDRLAQETDLVAPRDVDGHVLYQPVASSGEILFDYERPEISAKEFIFPATEVILRIEQRGQEATEEEALPERRQVVFGVRPCDGHGLAAIDALFLAQDPPDLPYRRRRELTTLVGLTCPRMWKGCFCTSLGGGPADPTHLDALLWQVEGGYAVQPVTDKGAALLASLDLADWPGDPPPPAADAPLFPATDPEAWRPLFADKLWQRHGERCLSCRICTYVCPACRCFDVTDRVVEVQPGLTRIERIRVWDACTSPNYRRVAGGHNPRPTRAERLRNRFYCKFCYYPQDFGPRGCVGCGRCVVACPVDIDITEVMRDVAGK